MKKVLLTSLAVILCMAVVAQKPQVKNGVYVRNFKKDQKITFEPIEKTVVSPFSAAKKGLKNGDNTNIVSIITLGTSANTFGYSGGSRTMVWADDDLNCVINFHRAGPGATPPSLSGYYAMDLGLNMGAGEDDWTSQIIASNALLASSPYYYDAGRYPSAGIYNPDGNTSLANAYCAFFGPNFANLIVSGFGGYTYGRINLVNHADTIKNLRWYNPTPYTYVCDGFTISSKTGISHLVDIDINAESGTETYQDSVIYGRGVWNTTTKDFDYTFTTLPFHCVDMYTRGCADVKIAASPDGNTVWMSALTNLVGATPLIDSTYFPVLRRSTDGGLTWGEPIAVQLDGPNGIDGIKNNYSDYFIQNFFVGPPFPNRDEIPYTCAFDHSLSVDKWGNPHIGVVIGYAPGGYSISTGVDSLLTIFDVYSVDDGAHWSAVAMGSITTFRGEWGDMSCDNRAYISRNPAGDKMFFTWNDTHIDGETNNLNPDVLARGFDLINNKITSVNGVNTYNNVTFLCDITQEAYFQCTSPIVFTDNNKYTLPICTQWSTDIAAADAKFYYISDFSYTDADFTIPVGNIGFPIGLAENNDMARVVVYPNPVKDYAKVSLTLKQNANVTVEVTNLVGQQVMTLNKGNMTAGAQHFNLDATKLGSGVYFVTVYVNGEKFTQKLVVE